MTTQPKKERGERAHTHTHIGGEEREVDFMHARAELSLSLSLESTFSFEMGWRRKEKVVERERERESTTADCCWMKLLPLRYVLVVDGGGAADARGGILCRGLVYYYPCPSRIGGSRQGGSRAREGGSNGILKDKAHGLSSPNGTHQFGAYTYR